MAITIDNKVTITIGAELTERTLSDGAKYKEFQTNKDEFGNYDQVDIEQIIEDLNLPQGNYKIIIQIEKE